MSPLSSSSTHMFQTCRRTEQLNSKLDLMYDNAMQLFWDFHSTFIPNKKFTIGKLWHKRKPLNAQVISVNTEKKVGECLMFNLVKFKNLAFCISSARYSNSLRGERKWSVG